MFTAVRQHIGPLFTRVWIYDLEPYSSRLGKLTRQYLVTKTAFTIGNI